ncbi:MAG: hypothetical protein IPK74_13530 [Deltaproteobacteria bacterium]|nr:hypothetical protein [Deltaproteobacteria bacterium]
MSRDGKLDVVIRTSDAARGQAHRRPGRARARGPGGPGHPARIPIDKLLEAAGDASVVRMQLAVELQPHLNLPTRPAR